ncbi:MAG: hypothetical protein ACKOE5_06800 [Cytophagales bacterium]
MRTTLLLLLFAHQLTFAQSLITPATVSIDLQYLKAGTSKQTWYVWQDTLRLAIGEVETIIQPRYQKTKLLIITKVKMNRANTPWTDSTVAERKTLSPIYHSSYNAQRNMQLTYSAKKVRVWHKDNITGKISSVTDTLSKSCFDSNLDAHLICWLPLKDGFTGTIQNYNYANEKSHGLTTVQILSVKEVDHTTPYYDVMLLDDETKSIMVFSIRKADRKVLKSKMEFGGRRMEME